MHRIPGSPCSWPPRYVEVKINEKDGDWPHPSLLTLLRYIQRVDQQLGRDRSSGADTTLDLTGFPSVDIMGLVLSEARR